MHGHTARKRQDKVLNWGFSASKAQVLNPYTLVLPRRPILGYQFCYLIAMQPQANPLISLGQLPGGCKVAGWIPGSCLCSPPLWVPTQALPDSVTQILLLGISMSSTSLWASPSILFGNPLVPSPLFSLQDFYYYVKLQVTLNRERGERFAPENQ